MEGNERKRQLISAMLWIGVALILGLEIFLLCSVVIPLIKKFLPSWLRLPSWLKFGSGIVVVGITAWKLLAVEVPRGKKRVFLPLETILDVKGPGLHFVPFGRVIKTVDVPMEIMELEYNVFNVVTRKGTYYFEYPYLSRYLKASKQEEREKLKNIIEPLLKKEKFDKELDFNKKVEIVAQKMRSGEASKEWNSIECESTTIPKISFGVYIRYPSDVEGIKKILDVWGGILSKKEIEDKLSSFLEGSIREIIGRVTWMVLVANREHIERELLFVLREENSILVQAGFPVENISVRITEVVLPRELAESLHLPQVASLRKEAAVNMINGLRKEGVDVNVAAMLAEKKEPVVIYISGGEGNLETLGVKLGAAVKAGMEAMKKGRVEEKRKERMEKKNPHAEKMKRMTVTEKTAYNIKLWDEFLKESQQEKRKK